MRWSGGALRAAIMGVVAVFVIVFATGCGGANQSGAGAVLWQFPTASLGVGAKAVSQDVAVVTDDEALVGVAADTGNELWRQDGAFDDVVVAGGQIYAACCERDGSSIVAIDGQSGTVLWRAEGPDAKGFGAVTLGAAAPTQNVLVVSSNEGDVVGLDLTSGKQRWITAADVFGVPVVSNNIAVVPGTGKAVGVDITTGKVAWSLPTAAALEFSTPVVQGENFAFTSSLSDPVGASEGESVPTQVIAVDSQTGKKAWEYQTDAVELTAPVLAGDLVVAAVAKSFSGSTAGVLAFDGRSDEPTWVASDVGRRVQQLAGSSGGVYVASGGSAAVVALAVGDGSQQWTYDFGEVDVDKLAATDNAVWAVGNADTLVGLAQGSGAVEASYRANAAIVTLDVNPDSIFVGTYGEGLVALSG
ncbi:MAG: PQQ-binding-like beta-propeller repeat protein [Actinobacteria bacterium]|nr:PQQ-binding-like beta-propeller repeat protein [Actinomycetota bacterium]